MCIVFKRLFGIICLINAKNDFLMVLLLSCRYLCNCTDTGFSGVNCQDEINECESNPCQNSATCSDLINVRHCAVIMAWYISRVCTAYVWSLGCFRRTTVRVSMGLWESTVRLTSTSAPQTPVKTTPLVYNDHRVTSMTSPRPTDTTAHVLKGLQVSLEDLIQQDLMR